MRPSGSRLLEFLKRDPWRRRLVLSVVVTIVLLRLWLVAGQTITALGHAAHDDANFLAHADSLTSGKWLGPYSQMTLIKGPFYPMWVAMVFGLGIPLLFSEHLLYVASCGVLVWALYPVLRGTAVRITLFAVLLFNPASFSEGVMSRVLRESIYGSLSLLVLGTAFGLAFRLDRPFRSVLAWILGLGASLATYYLCREERIWLLPSLLVILAGVLAHRPTAWRVVARRVGIALAVFAVLVGAVMVKNRIQYGVYATTEFTEGPFMKAYSTLARVRHEVDTPHLPIPYETRQRIYKVSPRFTELAPYLEGDGRGWSAHGCHFYGICDDIATGWMMWALREAAAVAKHYKTGQEAAEYWTEVAAEVNNACDDGRLECGPQGFGFLPPLRRIDIKAFGETLASTIQDVAQLRGIVIHPGPSDGPADQLDKFFDITRTRLTPDRKGVVGKLWHQDGLTARKETVLQWILVVYREVLPLFACVALLAFGVAVVIAILRRHGAGSLLTAGALLVATSSRVGILSLVQSSSFPSVNAAYLTPTRALLVGFVVLAFHAAVVAVREVRKSRKDDNPMVLEVTSDSLKCS